MRALRSGRRVVSGDEAADFDPDLHDFEWSDDLETCVITRREGMSEERDGRAAHYED